MNLFLALFLLIRPPPLRTVMFRTSVSYSDATTRVEDGWSLVQWKKSPGGLVCSVDSTKGWRQNEDRRRHCLEISVQEQGKCYIFLFRVLLDGNFSSTDSALCLGLC